MMATDLGDEQLKLKLTIAMDENPDLFRVLRDIKEPRRRTRRLKDLAIKGLLMERTPMPLRSEALPAAEQPAMHARRPVAQSVASMLEWEGGTAP